MQSSLRDWFACFWHPGLCPGLPSAVPSGLFSDVVLTPIHSSEASPFDKLRAGCGAVGCFQSSLRDWFACVSGTQDFVLGYFRPSLRDSFRTLFWRRSHSSEACPFRQAEGRLWGTRGCCVRDDIWNGSAGCCCGQDVFHVYPLGGVVAGVAGGAVFVSFASVAGFLQPFE